MQTLWLVDFPSVGDVCNNHYHLLHRNLDCRSEILIFVTAIRVPLVDSENMISVDSALLANETKFQLN